MRAVRCPPASVAPPPGSLLESVRDLGARFPSAHLKPLAIVRADELDLSADPSGRTRVWLGLESLQITGSFKVRGALVALADELARDRSAHVFAASAGNHGAGVAWAARVLGARATVYVPRDAPAAKKARIAQHAELVVTVEPGYDACEAIAKDAAARRGAPFLSPYDDPRVACGNGASLAFEALRAMKPDLVIAPFGGGGLATGLAWGFAHAEVPARVWGAQSEASAAMAMSIERGAAVTELPAAHTFAEALEGGIAAAAFERARRAVSGVLVVSEIAIARAMTALAKELGLVVEGGGACAFAAVLEGLPEDLRGGDALVLLTGRNVDGARLDEAMRAASPWRTAAS